MVRHKTDPVAMDHARVTVLTFAGAYVVDAYGPELDERNAVTTPLIVATELMTTLSKKGKK